MNHEIPPYCLEINYKVKSSRRESSNVHIKHSENGLLELRLVWVHWQVEAVEACVGFRIWPPFVELCRLYGELLYLSSIAFKCSEPFKRDFGASCTKLQYFSQLLLWQILKELSKPNDGLWIVLIVSFVLGVFLPVFQINSRTSTECYFKFICFEDF